VEDVEQSISVREALLVWSVPKPMAGLRAVIVERELFFQLPHLTDHDDIRISRKRSRARRRERAVVGVPSRWCMLHLSFQYIPIGSSACDCSRRSMFTWSTKAASVVDDFPAADRFR